MDLGIQGKVALITGSARGLGFASALTLAKDGVRIVINDLKQEAVDQAVGRLKEAGHEAIGFAADVCSRDDINAMVEAATRNFGGIDILVNNAGFTRDKYLTKMSEEEWDSVVSTILKGSFHCTRAVLPHMMDRKWGRIVNISSRAHLGNPGQTNYSSAKAGLIGMTRSLAYELGKFNITANAVAPGLVATELVRGLETYEKLRTNALTRQPIQRMGEEDDIANAVAFLASERAGFITGETVHITGGRYST
ncbi:MAG: 3-oxoacyl-ACP reductase FabG [Cupriavidus necator]